MLPVSTEMTYSPTGCRYHKRSLEQGQSTETEYRFTIRESELRSLYLTLVEQKFDAISTHHEVIYDRGGIQVTVTARGRAYTVVDGGQTVVDGFWLAPWRRIYDHLQRLQDEALEGRSAG